MRRTLIPAQRRQLIQEYLESQHVARLTDLVDLVGASEATIRRDLEQLEAQGIAERTHGGAILIQRLSDEPLYASSALAHPEAKDAIGREACALVTDGATVLINSGTTTAAVLRHLRRRADLTHLTIVTNNLRAVKDAWPVGVEVLLLGGAFNARTQSMVGRFARDTLGQVGGDLAFIGIDGISLKHGVTTPSSLEAEIGQLMIERTRGPVYILADHSKWGVVSNYEIARLDRIHGLVTDSSIESDAIHQLADRGVSVLVASTQTEPGSGGNPALPEERIHAPVWQEER